MDAQAQTKITFASNFNENDLANEMHDPTPKKPADETIPQVDPDEFETIYQWFIS